MKKLFRAACAGIALTAALTATALAADYTECADHLKDMNLFRGTTQGYELDRAPTRAEAAAMLVRLLGKEEEAKALTYTAPFTDLSGWEKPYVQYLYENGLTRGATATTFAPGGRCTAQMYAAFLLRALGYTEADGDFAYANAVAFAEQTGVYDAITIDTVDFLRDDAAAASYAALAQTAKDSGGMLLTQLVASGAVDAQRAEPYQKLFRTYNRYLDAVKGMREVTALSVGQEMTLDAGSFKLKSSEQTATDLTALRSLTERTVTLSATGAADKTFNAESYVEDGSRYQTVNGVRSRRALTEEEQEGLFAGYGCVPVTLIDTISVSGQTYTITYNQAGERRLSAALDLIGAAVGSTEEMQMDGLKLVQQTEAGRIASQQMQMRFTLGEISGTMESTAQLRAVNDKVTVRRPAELEKYPLIR